MERFALLPLELATETSEVLTPLEVDEFSPEAAFSSPLPISLLLAGRALARETKGSGDTGFLSPTIG